MTDRRLFIFVEGPDDERFFSRIIRPQLTGEFRSVSMIMYACRKSTNIHRFIRGIEAMGHEYMVIADIDNERSVRAKREIIARRFSLPHWGQIIVIIREIESWYLAGLDPRASHALGIPPPGHTDGVTKEQFNQAIPGRYSSRIAFMSAILSRFSIPVAVGKNRSFQYFYHRYLERVPGVPALTLAAVDPPRDPPHEGNDHESAKTPKGPSDIL